MPLASRLQWVPPPPPVSAFAVEDASAQIVWTEIGPGEIEITLTERSSARSQAQSLTHLGGPGAVVVDGLLADTEYDAVISGAPFGATRHRCAFRTLAPPPGDVLFRIATVNDVHIGSERFGVTKLMKERPAPTITSGTRCAMAAFEAIEDWNPDHLVIKGDYVHDRLEEQWEVGRALIDQLGAPWDFSLGNHETWDGDARAVLTDWGYACADPVRIRDCPGIRLIMADTALPGSHRGSVHHIHEPIMDALSDASTPVLLFLHHNLQPRRWPWMVPSGVPGPEATRLLDAIAATQPNTLIASGHTHRHRRRTHAGMPVVEVGSTKDYPGTWAGYIVHEGGVRQVVRRVDQPDCLAWTDYTRRGAAHTWGRWSPGTLEDRCFTHPWR